GDRGGAGDDPYGTDRGTDPGGGNGTAGLRGALDASGSRVGASFRRGAPDARRPGLSPPPGLSRPLARRSEPTRPPPGGSAVHAVQVRAQQLALLTVGDLVERRVSERQVPLHFLGRAA